MGETAVVRGAVLNCACGWKAGSGDGTVWTKGQRGPEPVFHGLTIAVTKRNNQQTMKMILEKIRYLLHRGPGTSRVFWLQTEFSFSTRRPS